MKIMLSLNIVPQYLPGAQLDPVGLWGPSNLVVPENMQREGLNDKENLNTYIYGIQEIFSIFLNLFL